MKRRPVVILTRIEVIPHLNQLTAAPVTRNIRSIPTEVELDRSDGMLAPCAVNLDNLVAVRPAYLTSRLTTLGPGHMSRVCEALRHAVGC